MRQATNREIISFLRLASDDLGFIDHLKMCYRPLICPFQPLLSLIKRGDYVADIGCGLGQFSLIATKFSEAKFILGIDIKEGLVNQTRQRYNQQSQIEGLFLQFDGVNFPDQISNANIVFLIDVFHHVHPDKQRIFINNLFCCMKKGATLVVKDIDKDSHFVYFNKLHDLFFSKQIGNEVSCTEMISLLNTQDTTVISVSKKRMLFFPHYIVVAKKTG